MSERQQKYRLGLFVFGTLLLLAGLIFFFGGATRWFSKYNPYTVIFTDAPGIAEGTPVRRSGVKVGEVSQVELDPDTGNVRVALRVSPKFTPRTSEEPTITRGLVVGDASIDFIPKLPEKIDRNDPYPPGSVIPGISPFNPRQLITQATDIIPEAQLSLIQIRNSMQKLEKLAPQVEETFKEVANLSKTVREAVPDVQKTNAQLQTLLSNTNDFFPSIRKTNEDVQFFLKMSTRTVEDIDIIIRTNEPKLVKAVESFTKTSDQVGKLLNDQNQKEFSRILNNVGNASDRFEGITKETEELLKETNKCFRGLVDDVRESIKEGRKVISDLRKITAPLGEKAEKILNNIDIGTDQFARALMDVREILRAVSRADGTLQKFLGDPAFYNNVNDVVIGVVRILPRLDRILKDVEVFADKIARHPESLGVGGAVRPNSGLKEAPTTGPMIRQK
jgi:phospholipid/cholesterol/gamma-HCH transport system substrate-binding protein